MKKLFLLLFVLASFALAGPEDNSLVVGTSQEPAVLSGDFLDVISNQAIKSEIELYLFDDLIRLDINGENVPGLATEVPTVDNGRLRFSETADGEQRLEMDLTLRDDITWSDGTPITTDDVQFYFDVGKAPGMPVLVPDYWERVDLEVVDERNFTVSFEPAFNTDLIGAPIGTAPAHIMRDAWQETTAAVAELNQETDAERIAETYKEFFTQFSTPEAINDGRMVYSGAFTADRWVPGSVIELARNPNYYREPPGGSDAYIQRVEYPFIEDTNGLTVAILGGRIDALSSVGPTFDQIRSPQVLNRAEGRFDVWFIPSPVWEHLDVNKFADNVETVADLQLADPRTRQALLHAMDRENLVDALFEGLQPVSHTFFNPTHPYYAQEVTEYDYNPERAAELFAELGWEMGPDGILQRTTEDGRTIPFELEIVTTAGNATRERVQQFLAEDLRQVGVNLQINNAPSSVVFSDDFIQRGIEGVWDGLFMFAWVSPLATNGDLYTCSNIPTPDNNFQGQNIGNWCNERYDELYQQGVTEFDLEAAKEIYQEAQQVWAEELPALPLYYRSNPMTTKVGLLNFVTNTYANSYGYPPVEPYLVGWESLGAEKLYDQAEYALTLDE